MILKISMKSTQLAISNKPFFIIVPVVLLAAIALVFELLLEVEAIPILTTILLLTLLLCTVGLKKFHLD